MTILGPKMPTKKKASQYPPNRLGMGKALSVVTSIAEKLVRTLRLCAVFFV